MRDRAARNRLLDFLVSKRAKCLDYLRQLHTTGGCLWLGCVRLTRQDLALYFRCEEGGASGLDPPSAMSAAWLSAGGGASSPAASTQAAAASPAVVSATIEASAAWTAVHGRLWFVLGASLARLLGCPVGGAAFAEALHELLLEWEHFSASGSAARALAARHLRKDREERGLPRFDDVDGHRPYAFLVTEPVLGFEPSYEALVPALCTTCIFVYRKLCDYEAAERESTFRRVLSADRKLKRGFFGLLSKELSRLAMFKVRRQYRWLDEHLFASFRGCAPAVVSTAAATLSETGGSPWSPSPHHGAATSVLVAPLGHCRTASSATDASDDASAAATPVSMRF